MGVESADPITLVEPTHDSVLYEVIKHVDKGARVVAPDSTPMHEQIAQGFVRGKVIAVGPGKILPNGQRAKPTCEPGDHVILDPTGRRVQVPNTGTRMLCLVDFTYVVAIDRRPEETLVREAVGKADEIQRRGT